MYGGAQLVAGALVPGAGLVGSLGPWSPRCPTARWLESGLLGAGVLVLGSWCWVLWVLGRAAGLGDLVGLESGLLGALGSWCWSARRWGLGPGPRSRAGLQGSCRAS